MFYQIILSPQVKRCAINTYKHGIYELPHELPNNLRLSHRQSVQTPKNDSPAPSPPAKMKMSLILAKNS